MSDAKLQVENLMKDFSGFVAVNGVSLSIKENKTYSIIGPNGAGKTTFFNLLTGRLTPSSGRITFNNADITDLSPEKIARLGLVRSYQIPTLFENLSSAENIRVAIQSRGTAYNFWKNKMEFDDMYERSMSVLDRVGLAEEADTRAFELGHGERRLLELGIVLSVDPELLLLDEPASGMGADGVGQLTDLLMEISGDLTVLIVEHNMDIVTEVSDEVIVFAEGEKIVQGPPEVVKDNDHVKKVYLGESMGDVNA